MYGRLPAGSWCPRWDSNSHCTGFESVSSASWDTRARVRAASHHRGCVGLVRRHNPAVADRPPPRHNVVMTGSTTDAAKPHRVLIAEDEALIRLDLAEMLRDEGYEVVGEAGDGQEAVELAESLKPDLVIMDVKMPRRDGIDAASEIASKRIAPIVVLTAFSQRELVERARDAGAMAYLVKPFSITDLIPAIEVAVSRFSEISCAGARSRHAGRPAGDPQARRAREGFAANQAADDRTRGVQVDSARGDGSPNDDEACRRGGAGNPRPARGRSPSS